MLTDKDLSRIDELIQKRLETQDLSRIDELIQERIEKSEKRLKNDILNFKDEILSEIQDLRDDVSVVTGYRQMLEDHEEDIEKLKQLHPRFSHS